MIRSRKEKLSLLLIITIYSVSNIILLINNGRFWDDWAGFNSTFEEMMNFAYRLGPTYHVYWQYYLLHLTNNPVLLFHWLTFIIGIVNIILFYKIISFFITEKPFCNYAITLLFAVIPYNSTKIIMACFNYSVGLLLFLTAILFFLSYIESRKIILRIISLAFFFLSFAFLNSTLVMFQAVIIYILFFYNKDKIINFIKTNVKYLFSSTKKNIISLIIDKTYQNKNSKRYCLIVFHKLLVWIDFIILPFLFWFIRITFFYPKGVYGSINYNKPVFIRIINFPIELLDVILNNLFNIFSQNINLDHKIDKTLYVIFFIIIFFIQRKMFGQNTNQLENTDKKKLLFLSGLFFFSAAAFPYIATGLHPNFNQGEYASRHQILLIIGASLIVLSFVLLLTKIIKNQIIILSLIIPLFMITTIKQQMAYTYSWLKQESLENHFKKIPELRNFNYFCVIDNAISYNETALYYDLDVYTGIYKKIYGTQNKYIADYNNYGLHKNMFEIFPEHKAVFNCRDILFINPPEYYLVINKNKKIQPEEVFFLIYQFHFNRVEFDKKIDSLLRIQLIKTI